jgi:hypothetical protein
MLCRGLLFLDIYVNQPWDPATAKTAGRFVLRFALGIAHETLVKRFLRTHEVIVVEGQLAAFAALEIFRHGFLLERYSPKIQATG